MDNEQSSSASNNPVNPPVAPSIEPAPMQGAVTPPAPQNPQAQTVVDSQTPPAAGSGKKNKFILIGIAVIVLIFIIVGVYFLVKSSKTTQPTETPADQQNREISTFSQEVEAEISGADPGTVEEDFTTVDQELNSL